MSENVDTGPSEAKRLVPGGVPPIAVLAAVCVLVLSVCAVLVGLAFAGELDNSSTPMVVSLIGIVTTAVPAVMAMAYSERTARDVRNGVLVKQSKQGATEAIIDQQVITRTGPVVSTELQALTELLKLAREGHTANDPDDVLRIEDLRDGPRHRA